jgi:cytochrome c peroxidase
MKHTIALFVPVMIFMTSCGGNQNETPVAEASPSKADQELLQQAQTFFQPLPAVAENPDNKITAEKTKLGKVLYFDTRLSLKGNNSCNSCHNLETYGVDNLPTSKGDAGNFGERNSPTVYNSGIHAIQFWDGRAKDVEEQAGGPILNPVEMAIPNEAFLEKKLRGVEEYKSMFKAAFPDDKEAITFANITKSIAAFERTLMTPSKFDDFLNKDNNALTAEEKDGLKTFMDAGCITCHNGPAVGGTMMQKFALFGDYRDYTHSKVNDEGLKKQTKKDSDKDMFKVPSLRNIEKTGPYFHDGSVADLKQVIKIMGKTELNKDLSEAEINKIYTFLKALTGKIPDAAKQTAYN